MNRVADQDKEGEEEYKRILKSNLHFNQVDEKTAQAIRQVAK